METSELLKRVKKIELRIKGLSNQVFTGGYHSAFKGRGMLFSEVREYQFGDDIRNIDWNVTARFNNPFVKVFEEERELNVIILVDVSASSILGSLLESKKEYMTEIAAVIAYSAIQNNDKVGLVLFSDKIEKFIPPQKGKMHFLRMIRELLETKPTGNGTDINVPLKLLANIMKKRSITFLLSDFISTPFTDTLRIVSSKHDIIGVSCRDQIEYDFPPIGLVWMKDLETGKMHWIDTSGHTKRVRFAENQKTELKKIKESFAKNNADFLELKVGQKYISELKTLFKQRGSRR